MPTRLVPTAVSPTMGHRLVVYRRLTCIIARVKASDERAIGGTVSRCEAPRSTNVKPLGLPTTRHSDASYLRSSYRVSGGHVTNTMYIRRLRQGVSKVTCSYGSFFRWSVYHSLLFFSQDGHVTDI